MRVSWSFEINQLWIGKALFDEQKAPRREALTQNCGDALQGREDRLDHRKDLFGHRNNRQRHRNNRQRYRKDLFGHRDDCLRHFDDCFRGRENVFGFGTWVSTIKSMPLWSMPWSFGGETTGKTLPRGRSVIRTEFSP